jgi:hypothetical protein
MIEEPKPVAWVVTTITDTDSSPCFFDEHLATQHYAKLRSSRNILPVYRRPSATPIDASLISQLKKGEYVARKVWAWLNESKAVGYVPWVLDPKSAKYDPKKAAEQATRDELLAELEEVIATAATAEIEP